MKKGEKGFTVIEVALVLAIAGLIFLMVFIALPGLRASQRDTTRRENMISLIDSIKKYQSNNRGALPGGNNSEDVFVSGGSDLSNKAASSWDGFYRDYLGENFIDPNGEPYSLRVVGCVAEGFEGDCTNENVSESNFPNEYTVYIVRQATCRGENTVASSNPRKIAVVYRLEGAGTYCGNS